MQIDPYANLTGPCLHASVDDVVVRLMVVMDMCHAALGVNQIVSVEGRRASRHL